MTAFTEQEKRNILNLLYGVYYTPNNPPLEIYYTTIKELLRAVKKGFGELKNYKIDSNQYAALKKIYENVFLGSAAKTWQQTNDYQRLMFDGDIKVSFKEFLKRTDGVFDKYNSDWLQTEFETTQSQSEAAKYWMEIQDDKDILPFLKFKTQGDNAVRQEHKALDGIVKHVNDPFWKTHYPPLDWRCRCFVQQLSQVDVDDENIDLNKDIPEVPFNPKIAGSGNKEVIFYKAHPYFKAPKEVRDNNYNLPKIDLG